MSFNSLPCPAARWREALVWGQLIISVRAGWSIHRIPSTLGAVTRITQNTPIHRTSSGNFGAALHVPEEAHPRHAISARQRPEGSPGDDRVDLEARRHQRRQGRRRGRAARRRGRSGVSSVFRSEARPGYLFFPGIFLSDRELLNIPE